ncbi:MAG: InlB B-repeat-containing protein [Clostridia bacterium]|nr:InlB B-repeat-containing protein [Clostridia bacterium]
MKRLIKRSICAVLTLCIMLSMFACAFSASAAGNVAKIGDTEYATLDAAHDAANAGDTIVLIGDVDTYFGVRKDITLDLNGHTLTNSNGGGDLITLKSGNLTVIDSVGTGKCISDFDNAENHYEPTIVWSRDSSKKIIIYGGTWTIDKDNSTNGGYAFAANMDIYGGTFICPKDSAYIHSLFNPDYKVNLYGGNFNENKVTPATDYQYATQPDGTYSVVPNHEHEYTVFVETVAPTYTTQGYDIYKCYACDNKTQTNFTDRIIAYSDWSITATEGGSVFINGEAADSSAQYEIGSTATLTVTAEDGYGFVGWQDGDGNVVSEKATYEIVFGETVTLVAVFSDDVETILNNEIAQINNVLMDGFVNDQWTLVGDNGTISIDNNGQLISQRRGHNTATSIEKYDVSNGFTLSGNFDFTGAKFSFSASYIKVGSLKLQLVPTDAYGPVTLQVLNGDTVLATSYNTIADNFSAGGALSKEYVFTVDGNGLLTVTMDGEKIAFGAEDTYTVDVSACSFDNANVIFFHGWVGDPGGGNAYFNNYKFYTTFPYTTVSAFTDFLASLTSSSSLATIKNAKALYNVVMENGSEGLKAAVEPYYSYITNAETTTWKALNVLTDENGTILIDDAAYDADAEAIAGSTHTVTAVPNARYNFAGFVDADGNIITTEPTYTFTVSAEIYIRATYVAKIYSNWSITSTEGGKVLIDGADIDASAEYEVGTQALLTVEAEEGYVFLFWKNAEGEFVSNDKEFLIKFEDNTSYHALFSSNPDDILDYELTTLKKVLIKDYLADEWTITDSNDCSYIKDGNLCLTTRMNAYATTNNAYNLSTGFELSGHFDFRSRGHNMQYAPYIQVGNLQIYISTSGTSSPVYLKVIDTATNTTLATSSEAVADAFTSDAMGADIKIAVDSKGLLTVKFNDQIVLWGESPAKSVDVSNVDLSAANIVVYLNWVSSTPQIVNTFTGIVLQQSIPYSTVADFQTYIDSVDTDDKAALELGKYFVSIVKEFGSDKLVSKINDFNFYKAKYDIGATVGGKILENGADFVNDYRTTNRLAVGTVLDLKAVAEAGYTFAYWADATGAIKSYDSAITVILGDKATTVTAVFTKDTANDGENVTISFQNRSGKVVAAVTVTNGTEVALPELDAAANFGYTVNGWVVNGEILTTGTITADADMIIYADYSKSSATYKVEIIGSVEKVDGKYSYNDIVKFTFDASILEDGEHFGGWCNEDGTIVSYNESYSFYVGADVELYAIITEEIVTDVPAISVTDASLINGGAQASFLTERYLPEGYSFVTAGVVYTASDDFDELTLDAVDGTSIRSRAVASMAGCGQYRQTIGSTTGATLNISLAAYLTYVDADGNMNTIYSSTYALTINQ